jgi:hypothetical protein
MHVMPTLAPTVEGRLLCACNCTYYIDGSGSLNPSAAAPYYAGAGFTNPPATFGGGVHNINACLVGANPDGVVVAFRGTLPIDPRLPIDLPNLDALLDWMNDFNADLVAADGMPGLVHHGFLGSLDSLWSAVSAEVNRLLPPGGALWITGHSKGGGIAPLAAVRMQAADITPRLITFAAPRAGNTEFANSYNAAFDHVRYEHADDIVPHLPPSADFLDVLSSLPIVGSRFAGLTRYEYRSVGALRFIDWSGHLVADSPTLNVVRFLNLAKRIVTGQFRQIGLDHRIDCGSGYMSAVCPPEVCS